MSFWSVLDFCEVFHQNNIYVYIKKMQLYNWKNMRVSILFTYARRYCSLIFMSLNYSVVQLENECVCISVRIIVFNIYRHHMTFASVINLNRFLLIVDIYITFTEVDLKTHNCSYLYFLGFSTFFQHLMPLFVVIYISEIFQKYYIYISI